MYFFCCLQVDGPINGGGGEGLVIGSLQCAIVRGEFARFAPKQN